MFCSRCGTQFADGSKFCPSCGLDLLSVTPLASQSTRAAAAAAEQTDEEMVREALKDEYEVQKELGRGGMAIVFKGRDKQLDRDVAIKVLPFSLAFDQEFVERFQREARTSAKLEHACIIPIYRVGRSGRVIYFVMKFLRGTSLSAMIEQRGALPPAEIRKILLETGGALGYAHRNGIVHRDIKPDNIMFDESGHAVVTDFGIAKAGTGTKLTGTGMAIGTPHYMSPEQARAQQLDGRSDIYSLGVVAFQCLTGAVPFDGEDAFSIGYKHITEPVPNPELKTAEQLRLFGVIRKMMAKTPDERFQTAEELLAQIEGKPIPMTAQATVAMAAAPTTAMPATGPFRSSTPTTPIPRTDPKLETPKKRKSGVLVGMFLLLLLGGGGAYYYFVALGGEWPTRPTGGTTPAVAAADSATARDSAAADSTPAQPVPTGPSAADLPNTGRLTLRGVPSRTRVLLDGQEQKDTVLTLLAGTYRLEITGPGFEPYSSTVALRRGGDTTVTAQVRRIAQQAAPVDPQPVAPVNVCEAPGDFYNRDGACYDAPPRALAVPLVPIDSTIQGNPTPAILWVHVSREGRAQRAQVARGSNDQRFTQMARGFALQLLYNPAQKNGQAVDGWVQMRFVAQRQLP